MATKKKKGKLGKRPPGSSDDTRTKFAGKVKGKLRPGLKELREMGKRPPGPTRVRRKRRR